MTILVFGGGGGGGRNTGGGGGAGGVRSNIPGFMPTTTAIPAVGPGAPNKLTVGAGGAGGHLIPRTPGSSGVDSSISGQGPISITSTGGGYGGRGVQAPRMPKLVDRWIWWWQCDDSGGPYAGGSANATAWMLVGQE